MGEHPLAFGMFSHSQEYISGLSGYLSGEAMFEVEGHITVMLQTGTSSLFHIWKLVSGAS